MLNILIFGGTTEGRLLFEEIYSYNKNTFLCVATDFGKEIVQTDEKNNIFAQRLDQGEIEQLAKKLKVDIVIDATHPFALCITENIKNACENNNIKVLRVEREIDEFCGNVFGSIDDAVEFLECKDGNILVTTGSNEIEKFAAISDYKKRVFARVLPVKQSIDKCFAIGLEGKNLICMQGKFSENMNIETIKLTSAKYLVTKNSGRVGGFEEKISACKKTGAIPVVIMPKPQDGVEFSQVIGIIKSLEKEGGRNRYEKD
ncbi:MAG: precorrin-6A reductase [Oscillospiraceae bacterium]